MHAQQCPCDQEKYYAKLANLFPLAAAFFCCCLCCWLHMRRPHRTMPCRCCHACIHVQHRLLFFFFFFFCVFFMFFFSFTLCMPRVASPCQHVSYHSYRSLLWLLFSFVLVVNSSLIRKTWGCCCWCMQPQPSCFSMIMHRRRHLHNLQQHEEEKKIITRYHGIKEYKFKILFTFFFSRSLSFSLTEGWQTNQCNTYWKYYKSRKSACRIVVV